MHGACHCHSAPGRFKAESCSFKIYNASVVCHQCLSIEIAHSMAYSWPTGSWRQCTLSVFSMNGNLSLSAPNAATTGAHIHSRRCA
jgi:hypothetical protein